VLAGKVFRRTNHCGFIYKTANNYIFQYLDSYVDSENSIGISVNLPLCKSAYISTILFPFFYNLLSEGNLKSMQCRSLRIDENDHFTRLIETTYSGTIGAVTIERIEVEEKEIYGRYKDVLL